MRGEGIQLETLPGELPPILNCICNARECCARRRRREKAAKLRRQCCRQLCKGGEESGRRNSGENASQEETGLIPRSGCQVFRLLPTASRGARSDARGAVEIKAAIVLLILRREIDIAQPARKGWCDCEGKGDRDGEPRRKDLEYGFA